MSTPAWGRQTERRFVHLVFADLVGFTSLVEHLDAEDVAMLQERYFARTRAVVESAGGQVEKFVGDAVLAAFGLPVLREDDAERTVEVGLDLVEATTRVARDVGLGEGALRLRVGVHSGDVVVTRDPTGPGWRLSGDVVTTAARLQSVAEPGTVVVGAETAFAVAAAFVLDPLGEVELRGRAAPENVWRVVSRRPEGLRERRVRPPLVGRESAIDGLLAAAAAAEPLVTVLAPPGAGRTRVVEEVRDRGRARGTAVWLTTVADPEDGYRCVADLLRQAMGWDVALPDDDTALATLTDRLAGPHGTGTRTGLAAGHCLALLTGAPCTALPSDLWASWTAALDAQRGVAPVWVLDDVHRAGPDLIAFLEHALDHPFRADRTVMVTARPGRAGRWTQRSHVVALDALDDADMASLLAGAGAPEVLDRDTVATITDAAGGNPLFVVELLREWRHRGRRPGGARGDRMPGTVRAIYLGQLDDLDDASREVLQTGSVAGPVLPAAALPELGVPHADHALGDLTGSGLLRGPHDDLLGPGAYTYRHVLLRDAAYDTLPRARRASLHLRFARWLQTHRVPGAAERAGLQLVAARDQSPTFGGPVDGTVTREELADRAAALLTEAGEARLGAEPQRAAQLFLRARDLGDPAAAAHRQVRAGEALRRAGRLVDAVEAFDAAGDLAADDDHRVLAAAALGLEDALFDSRLPRTQHNRRVHALLERAVAAVPTTDLALRSRLRAAGARARAYGGDPIAGERMAHDAVDLARASRDPGAVSYAVLALRPALAGPERLDERLAADAEMLAAATAAGDPERRFEALRLAFVDHLEAGDLAASERSRRDAAELAPHLGQPQYLWYPPMWEATTALLRGDLDAAEQRVEAFRESGERWHYRDTDQVHAVQLLALHSERGTPTGALDALRAAHARVGDRMLPTLAVAHARVGNLDRAREHLDALRPSRFAGVPHDGARSLLLAYLCETAGAVADRAAATELYRLLTPWRGRTVVVGSGALCEGAVTHFLGLAAHATGDQDTAAGHLREAIATNTAIGAPRLVERSRRALDRLDRSAPEPEPRRPR